jgi:hypothetical protein
MGVEAVRVVGNTGVVGKAFRQRLEVTTGMGCSFCC